MTHKNMPHEPIGELEFFTSQITCSCDEVIYGRAEKLAVARRMRDEAYAEHVKAKPAHPIVLRDGDVE